jgi:hypothetical protein
MKRAGGEKYKKKKKNKNNLLSKKVNETLEKEVFYIT